MCLITHLYDRLLPDLYNLIIFLINVHVFIWTHASKFKGNAKKKKKKSDLYLAIMPLFIFTMHLLFIKTDEESSRPKSEFKIKLFLSLQVLLEPRTIPTHWLTVAVVLFRWLLCCLLSPHDLCPTRTNCWLSHTGGVWWPHDTLAAYNASTKWFREKKKPRKIRSYLLRICVISINR